MELDIELQNLLDRSEKVLTLQDTKLKVQILEKIRHSTSMSNAKKQLRTLGITSSKVAQSAESLARFYHRIPALAFDEIVGEYEQP